jgi:endoribonuclease LACTB2
LSTPTEAASVVLARGPGSHEVFLVARARALRFMGGFHAFPGGKVHPSDAELATLCSARQVAAARELFEETGVLLARAPDGSFPPAGRGLSALRADLLRERVTFREVLGRLGVRLHPDDLTPAGELVTPEFAPVRFDTTFFVADLPPGQEAEVWPGELSAGAWASADEALRLWEQGTYLVSPPTLSLLELIRGLPARELPARLRPELARLDAGAIPPIWFSPGVRMVPLRCQGLPPTTHTNAYLVGTGPTYLIDPGPADPDEQRRLFDLLDEWRGQGRSLSAVVLTHHHPDHVGAARACARRYGVPVLAHPLAAKALAGKVEVNGEVVEGDHLDLGRAPHGRGSWHLRAVHTPGHAPGHLAFYEPSYELLFAGDMVSTLSSIIVAPPGGDLAVYLDSLRRLQTFPARLLLPAHGPPTTRAADVLAEALAHRARREQQLLAALTRSPRPVADLARELYTDLPAPLLRLAELQVLAGLHKLRGEGRAEEVGEGWVGG